MIDRRHIGVVSEERVVEVEKSQLRFFAQATGEADPIYFDEEAAYRAGHPALPAPPTFLFCLDLAAPPKRGNKLTEMGVNLRDVLHGEQSFTQRKLIYAGDRISLVTRTVDIFEKKGGALEFIVQDTTATNQQGELCGTMRTVTVVKNA